MTKKTRTTLFLLCLFLFILTATTAIFYSLGYRFDFKEKKFVQTGGIFLKVEPKSANVFINENLIKKTDFLFGTILIKNLLPDNHKVRVEKEGFYPWEKVLEVREKEVTEAKNICLIPEKLNYKELANEITNFWPFPSGEKFLLETKINGDLKKNILDLEKIPPVLIPTATSEIESFFNSPINDTPYRLDSSGYLFKGEEKLTDRVFKDFKISPDSKKMLLINDYEIWVLFLDSLEKRFLTRFSKKIGEIFWYNSNYLIFRAGEEIKVTEIDNRDKLNIVNLANFTEIQSDELKIFFDQINGKLYILKQGNLLVSEKLLP